MDTTVTTVIDPDGQPFDVFGNGRSIKQGLRVIVWVKKQHKSHKVAVDIEE